MPPEGDLELVRAAQADPACFVTLYDRHFAKVHRYIRSQVPDRALCEDLTSQVFMTALAKIHDFRGEGSFGGWLFRIAQRAVRDAHAAAVPGAQGADDLVATLADDAAGPEEQALARERRVNVRTAVGGLRPEQQRVLALRFVGDLSAAEIGRTLGKSAEAVRVSLHRALRDLRGRVPRDI